MGRSYAILVSVLAVIGLSAVQAETLYKWVDSQGRVSYHDRPPPEGSDYRVEQKNLGSPGGAARESGKKVPVILYSAPKCASCDLARIYLDKRKVPYTEKNVESDIKLQQELKQKTGTVSVPTIVIGEKVMNGFLESLLEGELNAAGYLKAGSSATAADTGDNEEQAETENKPDNGAPMPEDSDQPAQQ